MLKQLSWCESNIKEKHMYSVLEIKTNPKVAEWQMGHNLGQLALNFS